MTTIVTRRPSYYIFILFIYIFCSLKFGKFFFCSYPPPSCKAAPMIRSLKSSDWETVGLIWDKLNRKTQIVTKWKGGTTMCLLTPPEYTMIRKQWYWATSSQTQLATVPRPERCRSFCTRLRAPDLIVYGWLVAVVYRDIKQCSMFRSSKHNGGGQQHHYHIRA